MSTRLSLVLLMALTIALVGCSNPRLKDRQLGLERTLNAYSSTARWGNLADLYGFLTPELAAQLTPPSTLENIRVTQYETLRSPDPEGEFASVNVRISYVHQDRQVVQSIDDQQSWRYDVADGWRRNNPIPTMP